MFRDILYYPALAQVPVINPDPVPHAPAYGPPRTNYLTGVVWSRYQGVAEVVVTGLEDTAIPYPVQPVAPVKQIRILPLPVLANTGIPPNG